MSSRITMADVAREAGVSQMTVSRVINNKGAVSASTRRRVLDIVDRLDYRPSGIARGLATQRTGTLGLVVPDIANPFFSAVARGVEHEANGRHYSVLLCSSDEDPQRELSSLQSLEEKRVDGLVLCSSRLDDDVLIQVMDRHPAVVLVNRRLPDRPTSAVLIDDEQGGRLATQFLLNNGHRAVGFVAGPANSYSGCQRLLGFRAALAAAQIPWQETWIRHCAPLVEEGRRAAGSLLADQAELTALFCYNDLVAVGAVQACAELGRPVPDHVAVVGFDDIALAALVTPPLTTCRVPQEELGRQALCLLLGHIDGDMDVGQEIVLRPQLIVRASAPARAAVQLAEISPKTEEVPIEPIAA